MTKRGVLAWILFFVAVPAALFMIGTFLYPHWETYRVGLETKDFIREHLAQLPFSEDKFALLDRSLAQVDPELKGLYCEFGVFRGTTINFIASKTQANVHGFDSFEGLPEDWRPGFERSQFDMGGSLPKVRSNVTLHKGWFDEVLPGWAAKYPGPLIFLHMDADLYSSTKTVFDLLGDRIVPGTVIQFDEYYNYVGWKDGEYKAFAELVAKEKIEFDYIGYSGEQVAVKIRSTAANRAAR